MGGGLSGKNNKRVLRISGNSHIRLKNIEITGGYARKGGGLYISGEDSIDNSRIRYKDGNKYAESHKSEDEEMSDEEFNERFDDLIIDLKPPKHILNEKPAVVIGRDVKIVNNHAVYGGGVYVEAPYILNMIDGSIKNNKAEWGGGIYIDGEGIFSYIPASLVLAGGNISGNSGDSGGGIHITGGGICKINGGEIAGNSVCNSGGGIRVDRMGRCEINGGFIRGNLALTGGGISADNDSKLKITGGMVFGNRTGSQKYPDNIGGYGGGGISLYDVAVFEMSGGSVNGNYAGGSGGGIEIRGSINESFDIKISSGTICGNISGYKGGGISLENYTLVVSEDVYICGNQAKETGGGIIAVDRKYYNNPTKLIIDGRPKINGNLPNEVVIDEG